MAWARWSVAAAIGLACWTCAVAFAHRPDDCVWQEAQSLRELPAGIQALLGVGLGGDDGIADRGDSFNAGDAVADNTPMRRFALGIVNGDTAVVAVEQGGRGYSVQVMEFHQAGATWAPARCTALFDVPRHGSDLLEAFSGHASGTALPCRAGDGQVSGHVSGNVSGHVSSTTGAAVASPAASPASPARARVRQRPGA